MKNTDILFVEKLFGRYDINADDMYWTRQCLSQRFPLVERVDAFSTREAASSTLLEDCREDSEVLSHTMGLVCSHLSSLALQRREEGFDCDDVSPMGCESDINLGSEDTELPREVCGLSNASGFACYANSIMQQLYMIPSVRTAVLAGRGVHPGVKEARSDRGETCAAAQQLFQEMMHGDRRRAKCDSLLAVMQHTRQHDRYDCTTMQDAVRFLIDLLSLLEPPPLHSASSVPSSSLITARICRTIGKKCRELDVYTLPVAVGDAPVSLVEALRAAAAPCDVDGSPGVMISERLIGPPPHLFIHLKRFAYDSKNGCTRKTDGSVEVALTLDTATFAPVDEGCGRSYQLGGVVVHSGEADDGHYTSLVRHRASGAWLLCDDARITRCAEGDVLSMAAGGALMLVYDLVAPSPTHAERAPTHAERAEQAGEQEARRVVRWRRVAQHNAFAWGSRFGLDSVFTGFLEHLAEIDDGSESNTSLPVCLASTRLALTLCEDHVRARLAAAKAQLSEECRTRLFALGLKGLGRDNHSGSDMALLTSPMLLIRTAEMLCESESRSSMRMAQEAVQLLLRRACSTEAVSACAACLRALLVSKLTTCLQGNAAKRCSPLRLVGTSVAAGASDTAVCLLATFAEWAIHLCDDCQDGMGRDDSDTHRISLYNVLCKLPRVWKQSVGSCMSGGQIHQRLAPLFARLATAVSVCYQSSTPGTAVLGKRAKDPAELVKVLDAMGDGAQNATQISDTLAETSFAYDSDDDGSEVVGRRLAVRWSNRKWYEATVERFDSISGRHTLRYDDGDSKKYVLSQKANWRFLK